MVCQLDCNEKKHREKVVIKDNLEGEIYRALDLLGQFFVNYGPPVSPGNDASA